MANSLCPFHWGKFNMSFHPWQEPVERLLKEATKLKIQVITPYIVILFGRTSPGTIPGGRNKLTVLFLIGCEYVTFVARYSDVMDRPKGLI
jgi:hypothetical protein